MFSVCLTSRPWLLFWISQLFIMWFSYNFENGEQHAHRSWYYLIWSSVIVIGNVHIYVNHEGKKKTELRTRTFRPRTFPGSWVQTPPWVNYFSFLFPKILEFFFLLELGTGTENRTGILPVFLHCTGICTGLPPYCHTSDITMDDTSSYDLTVI